jgi:hypothetical protein
MIAGSAIVAISARMSACATGSSPPTRSGQITLL